MASFFRGFQSTPFQQAVEKVTDGTQPTEDWDAIMKICDHVSVNEENAKDAMKVIRKRLQTNPVANGWRSIGLTLTLLEALTKNCGKIFHLQIAQKDFLKEFRAVLNPKNSPPTAIQEQILGMIQTWAVAFRDDPDLKNVEQFYQECRQQGIEFPPAEPDSIIKAAVSSTGTMPQPTNQGRPMSQTGPSSHQTRTGSAGSSEGMVIRQITAEQLAKLRSELDVVQTNGQIFGEMLVVLQPGEEHPDDLELLLELHKTCKQMQARIIDLLSQISIDDMTVDLLRYNDEFNNSFKTFDSYMEERERRVGPLPVPTAVAMQAATAAAATVTATSSSSPTRKPDNEPALIKFDDESANLPTGLQNLHMNPPSQESPLKSTASPPNTASVTTRTVSNHQESEETVAPMDDKQLISEQEIHLDLPSTSLNTHSTA